MLERLDTEGCSRFVVTDVTKDGTLNGPNLELLAGVAERTDAPIIASGGVSRSRRSACHRDADRRRYRGCDRREGAVCRPFHPSRGTRRGESVDRMAFDETDLDGLVAEATIILDAAAKPFIAGHRAQSAVAKKGNDFATEVDLAIERQVVRALEETTGIGVHGEEFGGAPIDSHLVWVLDPIDGTFNYAAGLPTAAILLGLLRDGVPIAGLTWLPFTGCALHRRGRRAVVRQRNCAACTEDGQTERLRRRHRHVQRRLAWRVPRPLSDGSSRAVESSVFAGADARFRRGIDFAYAGAGILGGRHQLRPPRVGTTRREWHSSGQLAASSPISLARTGRRRHARRWRGVPSVHAQILEMAAAVGSPGEY